MDPRAELSTTPPESALGEEARWWDWAFMHAAPVFERRMNDVYGPEFGHEVQNLSYVSRENVEWVERHLELGPDLDLLDVGCGRGGHGLWVAGRTRARLVGLDISPVAIGRARDLATTFAQVVNCRFVVGSAAQMPFEDASFDCAMSIDVLQLVPTRESIHEVARVLRPGGRLAFTSWEALDETAERALFPRDYRAILADAGFLVTGHVRSHTDQDKLKAWCDLVLADLDANHDLSDDVKTALQERAAHVRDLCDHNVRVFVAAARPQ